MKNRLSTYRTGYPLYNILPYCIIKSVKYELIEAEFLNKYRNSSTQNNIDYVDGGSEWITIKPSIEEIESHLERIKLRLVDFDYKLISGSDLNNYIADINNNIKIENEIKSNRRKQILEEFNEEVVDEVVDKIKVRYYQESALTALHNAENGKLILPTGTGKTVIFLEYLKTKVGISLIIVPSIQLVNQTYNRAKSTGFNNVYRYYSKYKDDVSTLQNAIIITTYQSAGKKDNFLLSWYYDTIIFDECHRTSLSTVKSDISCFQRFLHYGNTNEKFFFTATEKNVSMDEEYDDGDDLYLSSMNDEDLYGQEIFRYKFSQAIKDKFISDYDIKIVVTQDKVKSLVKKVKEQLQKPKTKILIYCSNTTLTKTLTTKLKKELKSSIYRLTSQTKHRQEVINDFKSKDKAVLILCKMCITGFDEPTIDNVIHYDMTKSVIELSQKNGRALRILPNEPYANKRALFTFLLDENSEQDSETILITMKNMMEQDPRLEQSLDRKSINSRNSIGKNKKEIPSVEIDIDSDYTLTFDKFANVISIENITNYFKTRFNLWADNLEAVCNYIDEHKKRPSNTSKDKRTKQLGGWITTQTQTYKKKAKIMSNLEIRKKWEDFTEKYSEYFKSNEEIWNDSLEAVSKYIDENKEKPLRSIKDKKIKKLGKWISHQTTNYKKNVRIMSDPICRKKWEDFTERYSEHFKSNEEQWNDNLEEVSVYIDEYKERPSQYSKDKRTKQLGSWLYYQTENYKKNAQIMSDPIYRKKWEDFTEKYSEYFKPGEEIWGENLEELSVYIDEHKERPTTSNKDKRIKKLGMWVSHQTTNYKKKTHSMSNLLYRKKWEGFKEKYSEYFKSNEEQWGDNLEAVSLYFDGHKKRPSTRSKDKRTKQLGAWINTQNNNYKKKTWIMSNLIYRKKWEYFKGKYSEYFKSGEDP
jgi:superfamily II DNA or RNA helicase